MTATEENQTSSEAPYGYTIDATTGQLRPKKSPGRPRVHQVANESDPEAHAAALRSRQKTARDNFHASRPDYRSTYNAAWHERNPGKQSEYMKKSNLKLKREVIDAYGGKCACCGETELVFLTIDHVENDGAEHRREMAGESGNYSQAGTRTYRWLRERNYPAGFQVLCANCNYGKQWNGGICPHQTVEHPPS